MLPKDRDKPVTGTAGSNRNDGAGEEQIPRLTWKDLWQAPLAIAVLFACFVPGIFVACLPMLGGMVLASRIDTPFDYAPHESWLWRGLVVLCMTHLVYLSCRLLGWLGRRTSTELFPVGVLGLLAGLSAVVGTLVVHRDVLDSINLHWGKPEVIEGVMASSNRSCYGPFRSRYGGRTSRRTCHRETLFRTEQGVVYVRGDEYDRAILSLRTGDPVRLVGCRSILGLSLTRVKPGGLGQAHLYPSQALRYGLLSAGDSEQAPCQRLGSSLMDDPSLSLLWAPGRGMEGTRHA